MNDRMTERQSDYYNPLAHARWGLTADNLTTDNKITNFNSIKRKEEWIVHNDIKEIRTAAEHPML